MNNHMRVYVDIDGWLVTDAGDYLREASAQECDDSYSSEEGFIDVPEDVLSLIYINEDDGTTRAR